MKKLIVGAVALGLLATGYTAEWQVDKEAEDNNVTFTSQILGFSFQGVTDQIDGYLYWEGETLFEKNNQLLFQVELNSLDSGIGKRDRDMRQTLKTDTWPHAIFKGEVVEHTPIDTLVNTYQVVVRGRMSLHGVEREMEATGRLALEPQGRAQLSSEFTLRLKDYDIEAPSLAAFVKVGEEIRVSVFCYLKQQP